MKTIDKNECRNNVMIDNSGAESIHLSVNRNFSERGKNLRITLTI